MMADRQTAALARVLISQTCVKQGIQEGQLVLHADRGGPMIAKSLALLLADLGVSKSHARPYNANDNPYSEAHFKTMKYRPDYPDQFDSERHTHHWARHFFHWYNYEHYHSALGLMVPADVHYGRDTIILHQRQQVLQIAYEMHPERFVRGPPSPPALPEAVWINPPRKESEKDNLTAVAEAVELGGKAEHRGDLSPNPQLYTT
jgi:putative transposase